MTITESPGLIGAAPRWSSAGSCRDASTVPSLSVTLPQLTLLFSAFIYMLISVFSFIITPFFYLSTPEFLLTFHRTSQLCPGQLHIEERLASFLKLQINETVDILTFPLYTFYKEVLSWILIMSYIKSFIT